MLSLLRYVVLQSLPARFSVGWKTFFLLSCRKYPAFVTGARPLLLEFPRVFLAAPPNKTLPGSLMCRGMKM